MFNLLPIFFTILGLSPDLTFNIVNTANQEDIQLISSQRDSICRSQLDGTNIPSPINPTINIVREQKITCHLQREPNHYELEAWFTRTSGTSSPLFGLEVQRIKNNRPFNGVPFIIEIKMIRDLEEYAQTVLLPQISNEDFFLETNPIHPETADRLQQSGYVRGSNSTYARTVN